MTARRLRYVLHGRGCHPSLSRWLAESTYPALLVVGMLVAIALVGK